MRAKAVSSEAAHELRQDRRIENILNNEGPLDTRRFIS
jgi:hypothetical protein